jgi:hypothetical protein
MRGQILVTQIKPGGTAQLLEVVHGLPGFTRTTPTCIRICHPRQGIADRVQVGTDIQAEVFKIIPGIDYYGQVFSRQNLGESMGELGTTDASGKGYNFQKIISKAGDSKHFRTTRLRKLKAFLKGVLSHAALKNQKSQSLPAAARFFPLGGLADNQ